MAEEISAKIVLEGEKEFRAALSAINSGLKVNDSELKKVAAQYGKNNQTAQALRSTYSALEKSLLSQKDKLNTLSQGIQQAASKYGEAGARTQQLQVEYNKTEGAIYSLNRAMEKASKSTEYLKSRNEEIATAIKEANLTLDTQTSLLVSAEQKYGNIHPITLKQKDAVEALRKEISALNDELKQNNKLIKENAEETESVGEESEKSAQSVKTLNIALGNLVADGIKKALSSFREFIGSGIELAANLETTEAALERVFGENGKIKIDAWADRAREDFGYSEAAAKSFADQIGFVISQYTDVDAKIRDVSLALLDGVDDWAAYLRVSPDKAVEATTAAISGNFRALQALRVPINDNILANSRYAQSLGAAYSELSENQKAAVRWNYVLELMEKATGAAADSQDTYTKNLFYLQQTIDEIKKTFAQEFVPTLTETLKTLNSYLNENSDTIDNLASAIGSLITFVVNLGAWLAKVPGWFYLVVASVTLTLGILNKIIPVFTLLSKSTLPATGTALAKFGTTASSAIPVILSLTAAAIALAAIIASIGYLVGNLNGKKFDLGLNEISKQINDVKNAVSGASRGFARGTLSAPRGLAWVGEKGPELVNFRGGERVYTAAQSRRMAQGSLESVSQPYMDKSSITIYTNDDNVLREVKDWWAHKRQRARAQGGF